MSRYVRAWLHNMKNMPSPKTAEFFFWFQNSWKNWKYYQQKDYGILRLMKLSTKIWISVHHFSKPMNSFAHCRSAVRGATKIKLKKVNKKRTVTVRRVIIFLNISRHPLLICLQCFLHQYKTLKAVATATAAKVLLTHAKNLKKVFWGFLVVFPLFNNFLG